MMRSLLRPTAIASILASAACAHVPGPTAGPERPQAGLRAFATQAEMAAYHRELVAAILSKPPLGSAQVEPGYPPPPPPPGDSTPAATPVPERIYGSPQLLAHGGHLMVLRNGRLTTVRVAGGALEPVTTADALGAGVDTEGMFYYGLQETGEGVRVLAARIEDGITESHVAGYRVGADGQMGPGGVTTLRSAGGLYAGSHVTRRLGDRVVFYEAIEIPLRDPDPTAALPMVRGAEGSLATTLNPRRVYRAVYPMSWGSDPRLHVVTVCGPATAEPACAATALYAPRPQVMHVSSNAVYLLTEHGDDAGLLYRMPLDGSAPSALRISGSTFSPHDFWESADGYLGVHLLHGGWTEEARSQLPIPTLLRVPLSAFGDGRRAPHPRHYRPLLRLGGFYYSRFTDDWLVYGNRPYSDYMVQSGLIPATERERLGIGMLRWADTTAPAWYPTRAPAQAFASAGNGGVLALAGGGDSLALVYLPLRPSARPVSMAAPAAEHWKGEMPGVVPHPDNTAESGLLAVTTGVRPTPYEWRSTGVAFIRYDSAGIRQVGALSLSGEPADEREVAPIFAHGRIFVLLGGELVEVAAEGDGIREIRRMALP